VVSFWTFLVLSFLLIRFPQVATNTPKSENTLAISVDPSVKTEELQVRYYMTGDFGGLGGFQVEQDGEHRILIHAEDGGMTAKSLKVAFDAPHCHIQTIRIDELSESSHENEFHCAPVGDSKLPGKFAPSPTTANRKSEIQIEYLGFWGHKFLV
jgi:hypothetical protein